jgi:hypothetical protein
VVLGVCFHSAAVMDCGDKATVDTEDRLEGDGEDDDDIHDHVHRDLRGVVSNQTRGQATQSLDEDLRVKRQTEREMERGSKRETDTRERSRDRECEIFT